MKQELTKSRDKNVLEHEPRSVNLWQISLILYTNMQTIGVATTKD